MSIGDSPILKIIAAQFSIVSKFFDMAYRQGWLMYLIIGLVALVVYIIFFS